MLIEPSFSMCGYVHVHPQLHKTLNYCQLQAQDLHKF